MSFRVSRSPLFGRGVVVVLIGGLAGACSINATRLANLTPPRAIGVGSGSQTAGLASVQTQELTPLAPVPAAFTPGGAGVASGTSPVVSRPPPPSQAPGAAHVIAAGETLYSLSRRYGTTPAKIAEVNGLASTDLVKIGQKLTIPSVDVARMTEAANARKAKADPAPADEATSEPTGETRVAEETNDADEKADVAKTVETGSKPTDPAQQAAQPVEVAAQPQKPDQPSVQPLAYTPVETEPVARLSRTSFRWPVRGRIISNFGSSLSGQTNDGINLAVPEGSPVKAAENGVVVYAGDELKGYGNLVLVRHEGDFVTAYAHASELLVKRGDTVRRGQIIAKVGQTGSVNAPQLHFEIRKGPKPVNPTDFLSGA